MLKIIEHIILRIVLSNKYELLIEEKLVHLTEIKQITIDFIDNNGDDICSYCHRMKSKDASDHPKKELIFRTNSSQSNYNAYVLLQNKLTNSYLELRTYYIKSELKKRKLIKLTRQNLKR